MTYIACQRCGEPCLHFAALLDHWKVVHGGARAWEVWPSRAEGNHAIGEFRIARIIDA